MEVHAHSHSERKKWTHYFRESLILFLTVSGGFNAKNSVKIKLKRVGNSRAEKKIKLWQRKDQFQVPLPF
jgi:hypothetical protein